LTRKGSISLFFSVELAVSFSPCVGRIKIKELLTKKYPSYWAAMPVIRQSCLFFEGPLEKSVWGIVALNR
jgi:hypothetical protein